MNIVAAQRITLTHDIKGGLEVQSDQLYRGLVALGHAVEIITTAHPTSRREVEDGRICTHYLPHSDPRRYTTKWWSESYAKLQELVYRGRADLLLSQSAGALGYLPRARRELGLPAVIIAHTALGSALYSQWRAARSLRGVLRLGYVLSQAPWHLRLWRQAVAEADAVITPSEEARQDVCAEFAADPARVHVVPNGVDVRHFAPSADARAAVRAELGLGAEQFVAIAVTRLVPEKGLPVALDALTHLPDMALLIAGTGSHAEAYQRQAAVLGITSRVRFLGFVPRERLPDYLSAADAFVMPTLCREGFPVSVVEAMASGLVPVASNLGGIPSAITAEQTGLLVRPGDVRGLARALRRLAQDSELRARLADAARTRALERFSVEQMVMGTLAVLEQATAGRPARRS